MNSLSRFANFAYSLTGRSKSMRAAIAYLRDKHSHARLQKAGTFSQHGEDKFILQALDNKPHGTYVDIGASHAFRLSNTYLLYQNGWRGICVDPIKASIQSHMRWRPEDQQILGGIARQHGQQEFYELVPSVLSTFDKSTAEQSVSDGSLLVATYQVPIQPLADVFSKMNDRHIDLLSVDVENYDFEVLASNDWNRFRPKLIIFECNDPNERKSHELLSAAGYVEHASLGCNFIYKNAA